jgi:hypothetical protein
MHRYRRQQIPGKRIGLDVFGEHVSKLRRGRLDAAVFQG